MEIEELEKGKWYMIRQYGFNHDIRGKFVESVGERKVVLKFYWGFPFRSRNVTEISNIIGECKRGRLFSND